MTSSEPLSDQLYPLIYKASPTAKFKMYLFIFFVLLFAFVKGHDLLRNPLACVPPAIILGWLTLQQINESSAVITLFENRLEKRTWFGTKIVFLHELTGIQYPRRGRMFIALRDRTKLRISLPGGIEREPAWQHWAARLPNKPI